MGIRICFFEEVLSVENLCMFVPLFSSLLCVCFCAVRPRGGKLRAQAHERRTEADALFLLEA